MKSKRNSRVRKAFQDDKKAFAELNKAIKLYDKKKYEKTLKILEKLNDKCCNNNDTVMVQFWCAMCMYSLQRYNEAINIFDKILRYDGQFFGCITAYGACIF